jgi:hypothetical protein
LTSGKPFVSSDLRFQIVFPSTSTVNVPDILRQGSSVTSPSSFSNVVSNSCAYHAERRSHRQPVQYLIRTLFACRCTSSALSETALGLLKNLGAMYECKKVAESDSTSKVRLRMSCKIEGKLLGHVYKYVISLCLWLYQTQRALHLLQWSRIGMWMAFIIQIFW